MLIAMVAFGAWAAWGPQPRLAYALVNAAAGVLIRNAEALEILEKVDTLVVDKTGTLTEGRPRLRAVIPAADVSEGEVLRLAASVEVGRSTRWRWRSWRAQRRAASSPLPRTISGP